MAKKPAGLYANIAAKKARIKAIAPTTATKIWKILRILSTVATVASMSSKNVASSLKKLLIPLAISSLRS